MKKPSLALISIGLAAVLGYVFGVRYGDLWVAVGIAVTSSIFLYSILSNPQDRHIEYGPKSKFWFAFICFSTPFFMIQLPNSELLSNELPVVVLLGLLWNGGMSVGVGLAHASQQDSSNHEKSGSRSSVSD